MARRGIGVALGVALLVASLTGCTGAQPRVIDGSVVKVGVDEPLTFLGGGDVSSTNAGVASLTRDQFYVADAEWQLVPDPGFGEVTLLPGSGFDVRYSLAGSATWSDGVAMGAADLLLAWVASSGALDSLLDDGFDLPKTIPVSDPALFPTVGDDGRSLTVHYGTETSGWQTLLDPQLAAHELARSALGIADAEAGSDAVIEAILQKDAAALSAIADAWNSQSPDSWLSSGPYDVAEWSESTVILSANPEYRGSRQPLVETIEIITVDDEAAAFAAGEVDIVSPAPSSRTQDALRAVPGATVLTADGAAVEHLDLQIAGGRSGVFADPLVREAFLRTIPRQQLVTELLGEVSADATLQSSFVVSHTSADYEQIVAGNGSDDYAEPDIAAAKELLDEAGVVAPEVCVLFDAGDASRVTEFQLIAEAAMQAGFVVTDCSTDDVGYRLGVRGAYDAALFAWSPPQSSTRWLTDLYSSEGSNNLTGYSSPAVDALLGDLASTTDAATSIDVLGKIDRELWSDAYGSPLFQHPTLTAWGPRVTGVVNSPLPSGLFWNASDWVPVASE